MEMLTVAIDAAKKAGELVAERYHGLPIKDFSYKDPHQVVSQTDLDSERIILDIISAAFPGHSFFSEEAGQSSQRSEYIWIIDPIDGSRQFLRHIPLFCISIALVKAGKPVVGVVYNPITKELYTASQGHGASYNDQSITVGSINELHKAVTAIGYPKIESETARSKKIFDILIDHAVPLRSYGASALELSYLAHGKLDMFIHNGVNLYDCAAGLLIAQEAGAISSNFKGEPFDWTSLRSDLVVANSVLHAKLVEILKQV